MSSFTTELKVSPLNNGTDWVITEPFTYFIGELGSDVFVTVPVGFVTDFASVPRFFWGVFPPWGQYGKATVIHDYLWRGNTMSRGGTIEAIDRKTSNLIFLEAMGVLDVNVVVRYAMYYAVSVVSLAKDLLGIVKRD